MACPAERTGRVICVVRRSVGSKEFDSEAFAVEDMLYALFLIDVRKLNRL